MGHDIFENNSFPFPIDILHIFFPCEEMLTKTKIEYIHDTYASRPAGSFHPAMRVAVHDVYLGQVLCMSNNLEILLKQAQ